MTKAYEKKHDFLVSKALYKKLKKIPDSIILKNTLYCTILGLDPELVRARAHEKRDDVNRYLFRSRSSKYAYILGAKIDRLLPVLEQIYYLSRPTKIVLTTKTTGSVNHTMPPEIYTQIQRFPTYINVRAVLRRMGNVSKGTTITKRCSTGEYPHFHTPAHTIALNKILARRLPKLGKAVAELADIVNEEAKYDPYDEIREALE